MTYPLVALGSVAPLLALNIYQENQTRNHNLLNIGITDRYILNIQTLHTKRTFVAFPMLVVLLIDELDNIVITLRCSMGLHLDIDKGGRVRTKHDYETGPRL
jgi:hypothetical protein